MVMRVMMRCELSEVGGGGNYGNEKWQGII